MMARQAMIIDMDRCVGCGACVIACQEEWDLPDGVMRNWVRPLFPISLPGGGEPVYTHDVGLCHHCRSAPCLGACPTGATTRDDHGRIVVDPETCIGCGYCVDACPYDARMIREDLGTVEKCDFCASLVDAGVRPACVSACPAGARIFGDLDERSSAVSTYFREHDVRQNVSAEVDTDPQVFYAGRDAVVERVFAEHRPDPEGLEPPLPGRLLGGGLRPAFLGMFGLMLTGLSVSFARVLIRGEEGEAESPRQPVVDPMLKRHDTAIIVLHWFNALVWLFQLVTGVALLASSEYVVTPGFFNRAVLATFGTPAVVLDFHITVGVIWLAVLLFYGVFGFKRYVRPFLRHLWVERIDLAWLRIKLRQMFFRPVEELPSQGKYNAGQKLFGWVISLSTVVSIASGLIMVLFPGSGWPIRWAVPAHFAAFAAAVVALALHIFMTTALSSERPALFAMIHGRIPESYARKHNRRWWEQHSERLRAN